MDCLKFSDGTNCCDSCHEDYDLGYECCEILVNDVWYEVCCSVSADEKGGESE